MGKNGIFSAFIKYILTHKYTFSYLRETEYVYTPSIRKSTGVFC